MHSSVVVKRNHLDAYVATNKSSLITESLPALYGSREIDQKGAQTERPITAYDAERSGIHAFSSRRTTGEFWRQRTSAAT